MKRVIIASKIENNFIYNLAKRLVKFIQDYDWYDYTDSLEIGETEEDAIESMVDSLSDKKGVQSIINTLNDILSEEPEVDEAIIKGLIKDISKLI